MNLRYHAKANTAIDNIIKYDLAGSIHEKFNAILLLPANNTITGVIQQNEAATAERKPTTMNVSGDFILIIRFQVFGFGH